MAEPITRDYEMFRPHIKRESPIWGYLNCVATYGKKSQVPKWIQEAVASTKPDFDSIAKSFAETSPPSRYLVQTSKVATIFNAGVKVSDPVSMPLPMDFSAAFDSMTFFQPFST